MRELTGPTPASPRSVFVSYAREDAGRIEELAGVLGDVGVAVWVDIAQLRAGEQWQETIERAISSSDLVVFALSASSARSGPCAWELATAIRLGKMVITAKLEAISDEQVPASLGDQQWIDAAGVGAADVAAGVIEALDTNFPALREHAAIARAAVQWRATGRRDLLLRGAGLRLAERWLLTHSGGVPTPTVEQCEFVSRSRRAATGRRTLALFSAVVLVVGSVIGLIQLSSQSQQNTERREALAISSLLTQAEARRVTDPAEALRLAVAAESIQHTASGEASLAATLSSTHLAHQVTGLNHDIDAVAVDDAGTLLAASSIVEDRIPLWDITDPYAPVALPAPLTGPGSRASALLFAPGDLLVGAGFDSMLSVWSVRDRTHPVLSAQSRLASGGSALARRTDGLLAVGETGRVTLWQLSAGGALSVRAALPGTFTRNVTDLAFSPEGGVLAVADNGADVTLWDLDDPDRPRRVGPTLTGPGLAVANLRFSQDGTTLVIGAGMGVERWDVSTPAAPVRLTPEHDLNTSVAALAVAPGTSRMLAAAEDGSVIVFDPGGPSSAVSRKSILTTPGGPVNAVAVSSAGRIAASGAANGLITLWTLDVPTIPPTIGDFRVGRTLAEDISDLAVGPSDTVLAGDADQKVTDWDITNPATPMQVPGTLIREEYAINAVSTATLQGLVAVKSPDGLHLWTFDRAGVHQHATLEVDDFTIDLPEFLPGRAVLAAGGAGGELVLWDVRDLDAIPSPTISEEAQRGNATALAVTPDGTMVAIGSADETIALWAVDGASPPALLRPPLPQHAASPDSIVFNSDGKLMISGADNGTVLVWDVTDRRNPEVITSLPSGLAINDLALSADDRLLAVSRGSQDPNGKSAVDLWDMADPRLPRPLGPGFVVTNGGARLALMPNQPVLAVSDGPTVHLIDLTALVALRGKAVHDACRIIGAGITPERWSQLATDVAYRPSC